MTCPNINEPRGCWNVRCQLGKVCINPERADAATPAQEMAQAGLGVPGQRVASDAATNPIAAPGAPIDTGEREAASVIEARRRLAANGNQLIQKLCAFSDLPKESLDYLKSVHAGISARCRSGYASEPPYESVVDILKQRGLFEWADTKDGRLTFDPFDFLVELSKAICNRPLAAPGAAIAPFEPAFFDTGKLKAADLHDLWKRSAPDGTGNAALQWHVAQFAHSLQAECGAAIAAREQEALVESPWVCDCGIERLFPAPCGECGTDAKTAASAMDCPVGINEQYPEDTQIIAAFEGIERSLATIPEGVEGYLDDLSEAVDGARVIVQALIQRRRRGSRKQEVDMVLVPRDLIGAACFAIESKRPAEKTVAELRRYTFGDLKQGGKS